MLGSTGKMGTGTNCQQLLTALHNLDVPYRPADLEQREGRIIRQGNTNDEVDIYNYIQYEEQPDLIGFRTLIKNDDASTSVDKYSNLMYYVT